MMLCHRTASHLVDKRSVVRYARRMRPKLSDEQRQAIQSTHDGPVEVEDDPTHRVYVIVARDEFHQLVEDQLRQKLQIGFDQADAGNIGDWDIETLLTEARRRHAPLAA